MRANVDAAALHAGWAWAKSRGLTPPIRLTVASPGDLLTLTGCDEDASRSAVIPSMRTAAGSVVVHPAEFAAAMKALPRRAGVVSVSSDRSAVTLRREEVTVSAGLWTVTPGNAPAMPAQMVARVSGENFAWSARRVSVAAATGDIAATTCVRFRTGDRMVGLTAMDQWRVACDLIPGTNVRNSEMLLPARHIHDLALRATSARHVEMFSDGMYGGLRAGAYSVVMRDYGSAGAQFPAVDNLMPDEASDVVLIADAATFSRALAAAAVVGSSVALSFAADAVTIRGLRDGKQASSATVTAKVLAGKPRDVRLNGAGVAELLDYIGGPLGLGMADGRQLIEFVAADPCDDYRVLVMPMGKAA